MLQNAQKRDKEKVLKNKVVLPQSVYWTFSLTFVIV